MYACWKSVPKSERQELFDFYTSLPKSNQGLGPYRATESYANCAPGNHSNLCCPFGMLLWMRYPVECQFEGITLPYVVQKWTGIEQHNAQRFMWAHDRNRPTDADLARMMGVEYSEGTTNGD